MNERALELQRRTKRFALELIGLADLLPRSRSGEVMARQLVRSGTSVAANYRAACRAKSPADFVAKMGTVEEEADETRFWLEMLDEAAVAERSRLQPLLTEADELISIVVASRKTARQRIATANRQSTFDNRQ